MHIPGLAMPGTMYQWQWSSSMVGLTIYIYIYIYIYVMGIGRRHGRHQNMALEHTCAHEHVLLDSCCPPGLCCSTAVAPHGSREEAETCRATPPGMVEGTSGACGRATRLRRQGRGGGASAQLLAYAPGDDGSELHDAVRGCGAEVSAFTGALQTK